jgi:hypothetical protein
MKWIIVGAAAGVAGLCLAAPLRASEPLDLFNSETTALQHCGGHAVVWLDVPARTYWLPGQSGFGGSPKRGGYTCRSDAIRSGNRAARE